MNKPNLIDLYLADVISNDDTVEWKSLFQCDESIQNEILQKAKNKRLLTELICSEEDFTKETYEIRKKLFDENKTFLLLEHSDFGGSVCWLMCTNEDVLEEECYCTDTTYTNIYSKSISKEQALQIFENHNDLINNMNWKQ